MKLRTIRNTGNKILEYSVVPGALRHHWGAEIDFNRLRNSYYVNGSGLVLCNWLKKNGIGLIDHWQQNSSESGNNYFQKIPVSIYKVSSFADNQAAAPLAPVYQRHINPDCAK